MNAKDKENAIQRYEARLKKYGESVKAIGWRDKKQQWLRFDILTQIGNLNNKNILDVGCGFGDLYSYAQEKNFKLTYTGFDISSKIIGIAKKNHPGLTFAVKDILLDRISRKFDYILSSGVLNHKISNNLKFAQEMIRKMFELSRIGLAVNMTTNYVDYKDDYLFYYSPEKIFKYARGLTRFVVLRHDYPLYEFTVYLYKKL